ncbi:hypothetical protein O7635_37925 [Asanoa sp. WMMD1127]|uniref:hypothetical protein n=1 Tax=Asanoa sp. WMMD1127 TaxID=3016107 RepID=UPI002416D41D|nr:hypothetical protein [Asanoa sp. WMMD1127]MDG4827654.1 hypothetical protein [Asanoa sp. WMMD1127]
MAEEEREEPRWSGAAPVPAPAPKRKRWLDDESVFPPPPPPPDSPPRDPTLDLPTGRAVEEDTPVDPWADADPLPSYPVSYPPTRPDPIVSAPPPPQLPVPVPAPAPTPPARTRKAKRRPEPAGPPPGWRPPPGYVAVPVRRRRRWPWFALLSLLCCCGCPAWFGQPMWTQYPASAAVPSAVDGLTLRDDPQSRRATQQLKDELNNAYMFKEGTFAGLFVDRDDKLATVFGTTGFHFSPDDDVTSEINRLTGPYHLRQVRTVESTERGESRRCGVGTDNGAEVVVCSWADHGSIGTGVFTRLDVNDSNKRLSRLRDTIVTRGSDG